MPFKYIDPKDAPEAPKKSGPSRAQYFIDLVEGLPADKVAEIVPEADQSIRGIKVSVGRVASARDIKIQSWDDGTRVFVKRLG